METTETYDLDICVDCLMLIANGEVGDRGDIGNLTEYQQSEDDAHLYNLPGDDHQNNAASRHAARIDAHWPAADGWTIAPNCPEECEGGFSWSGCDACGSTLGGERHPAVAMKVAR